MAHLFRTCLPCSVLHCLAAGLIALNIWLGWGLEWSNPYVVASLISVLILGGLAVGTICLFVLPRYWLRTISGMATCYVVIYVVLAVNGQYCWSRSGRLRYDAGISVTDRVVWNPLYLCWEPFRDVTGQDTTRGNLLGYLYSPLISLNRQWVHPTQVLFDKDGGGKLDSRIDLGRLGVKAR